jgi:hypothetical protein
MGAIGRAGGSDGSYEVCSRGLVVRFVLNNGIAHGKQFYFCPVSSFL